MGLSCVIDRTGWHLTQPVKSGGPAAEKPLAKAQE